MAPRKTPATPPTVNATPAKAAPAKTPRVAKPAGKAAARPAKPATAKPSTARAAAPAPASVPPAPASAAEAKPGKAKKPPKVRPVLVRDGFTMPESDFALIGTLKARALAGGRETKKSELLRAGLQALSAMDSATLRAALNALEPVKTGRPKKER